MSADQSVAAPVASTSPSGAFSVETGMGVYHWIGLRDVSICYERVVLSAEAAISSEQTKGRKKKPIDPIKLERERNTVNMRYSRWLSRSSRTGNYILISIDPARSRGSFALRIEERSHETVRTLRMSSLFLGEQFEEMYKSSSGSPAASATAEHTKGSQDKEEKESASDFFLVLQQLASALSEEIVPFVESFLRREVDSENTKVILVIERQLPDNYKLVRIQQHVMTVFQQSLGKYIMFSAVEIPPRLKSRQNNVDTGIKSSALKTWSIESARMLLERRRDEVGVHSLTRTKARATRKRTKDADVSSASAAPATRAPVPHKVDDLADTVNQAEAFAKLVGLPCPNVGDTYERANAAALERQRKRAKPLPTISSLLQTNTDNEDNEDNEDSE